MHVIATGPLLCSDTAYLVPGSLTRHSRPPVPSPRAGVTSGSLSRRCPRGADSRSGIKSPAAPGQPGNVENFPVRHCVVKRRELSRKLYPTEDRSQRTSEPL